MITLTKYLELHDADPDFQKWLASLIYDTPVKERYAKLAYEKCDRCDWINWLTNETDVGSIDCNIMLGMNECCDKQRKSFPWGVVEKAMLQQHPDE